MNSPPLTPGSLRWASVLLVACTVLGSALGVYSVQVAARPGDLDTGRFGLVADLSIVAAMVAAITVSALALPWRRWSHGWALTLAVAALALLVVVEFSSRYGESRQAAATYPLFVTLVLAWVGMTQPRRAALSFTLCGGAALTAVVLSAGRGVIPLASLVVVLPAGAALGEAAAWLMGELRRMERHDERRASTFIDLTRTLDELPHRSGAPAVAAALADTAAGLFATRAEVTLVDPTGLESRALAAPPQPLVAEAGTRAPNPSPVPAQLVLDLDDEGPDVLASRGSASTHPASTHPASQPNTPPEGVAAGPSPAGAPKRTTVTLVGKRGILGRVQLDLERDPEDAYLTNLLRLFAAQAAAALERLELVAQLDHEVNHDVLTGTGNRRHANTLLAKLRHDDGLLLIDVDRFKMINDTEGHLAGDELLQELGRYLTSYVRGSDDVARLGGDEFVVLARGVGTGVSSAATRLIEGWRALGASATVTIGVAVHRAGDEPSATLERADRVLYQAKRDGGDRVGRQSDEVNEPVT